MENKSISLEDINEQIRTYLAQAERGIVASPQGIDELASLIRWLQSKYYQENNAWVDDPTFDRLYALLRQSEEVAHIALKSSETIGSDLSSKPLSIKHYEPMLSLENAFNAEDLTSFDKRIAKGLDGEPYQYIIEPKIDGLSISLHFVNDQLVQAVTRGNGIEGDSVLQQVLQIKGLPTSLPLSQHGISRCEIRGEVYISKKDFSAINQLLAEQGKSPFSSPRNLAAGSLRLKDAEEVKQRRLSIIFYKLIVIDGKKEFARQWDTIAFLDALGLPTTLSYISTQGDIASVIAQCEQLEKTREHFPFEIDGLVVKIDNIPLQRLLGETSHHPKWAIALKLKAQSKRSTLLGVEFQISRNGTLTPVAKIEPVNVAGAVISSVSLFNEDFITEKGLCIGDPILVERSGDVIPYISAVIYHERNGKETPIHFPKECPNCGTTLHKQDTQWRCVNETCSKKVILSIVHFVSKDALDIEGLGEKIIRKLVAEKMIASVADIFRLPFERIKQLEGFGEKSASNLQSSIELSKQKAMPCILFGLGIRYVGINTAETVCGYVKDLKDLTQVSLEELKDLPDIGEKVAQSIFDYFREPRNLDMLLELERLGVQLNRQDEANEPLSDELQGMSFLFTGKLALFSRPTAEQLIKRHGGVILSTISKNLHTLVVGENAGSKLAKAQKIPSVRILNEQEFLEMLQTKNIQLN